VILLKIKLQLSLLGVSNVNTQIGFEGKTVAGNYVVKLDRSTPTP
jgi:hypothetical protein